MTHPDSRTPQAMRPLCPRRGLGTLKVVSEPLGFGERHCATEDTDKNHPGHRTQDTVENHPGHRCPGLR